MSGNLNQQRGYISPFVCNGASNHSASQRDPVDFYATPPAAIDGLLSKCQNFPKVILEPCCGCGSLSERLKELGFTVISEDLYDHGYGQPGVDFLQRPYMPNGCNCIVTNFPYNQILQMTLHALDILAPGGILCSFAKLSFLEGQARYSQLFQTAPPRCLFQFVKRLNCGKNGVFTDTSSAVAYAWFVWKKGYKGLTTTDWIVI